ncbi:MAG: ferredoxin family protein, partial [Thermoanaerobaculia bacterium]
MSTPTTRIKPKPVVLPQFCKACGRCIEACPKGCIQLGTEIEPATGFTPVILNLDECTACGLCFSACPEPYGLQPTLNEFETELFDPV